jgi:hypothetical protein
MKLPREYLSNEIAQWILNYKETCKSVVPHNNGYILSLFVSGEDFEYIREKEKMSVRLICSMVNQCKTKLGGECVHTIPHHRYVACHKGDCPENKLAICVNYKMVKEK